MRLANAPQMALLGLVLFLWPGCVMPGFATYRYEGIPFDMFLGLAGPATDVPIPPYEAGDRMTGTIIIPPLGRNVDRKNLQFPRGTEPSFAFSDGIQTLDNTNAFLHAAIVGTNGSGEIVTWIFNASAVTAGGVFETSNRPPPDIVRDIAGAPGVQAFTFSPGSWTRIQ